MRMLEAYCHLCDEETAMVARARRLWNICLVLIVLGFCFLFLAAWTDSLILYVTASGLTLAGLVTAIRATRSETRRERLRTLTTDVLVWLLAAQVKRDDFPGDDIVGVDNSGAVRRHEGAEK